MHFVSCLTNRKRAPCFYRVTEKKGTCVWERNAENAVEHGPIGALYTGFPRSPKLSRVFL